MRSRKIQTTITSVPLGDAGKARAASIGGWLQGKQTYIRIGVGPQDEYGGSLHGHKLYRLAKAIVKQFEEDGDA